MNKIKFTCTLLSDVILNQNAGSKEQQSTLDFIPGNVFLGIAASGLYQDLSADESMSLFHSGRVRFGDAHPLRDGNRALRIPAVLYYRKGESLTGDGAYVMYKWNPGDSQPKQCRNGFYVFMDNDCCLEVKTTTSVAIKSAYDRDKRCSKDEKMYAYESLGKGLRYAFEVEYDDAVDERIIDRLKRALVGKRHVGHSKTSQYGLVRIALEDFECVESRQVCEDGLAVAYADGRLIFIDESGMPTFWPTAQALGFGEGAEIDWEKSQVRTFQYAPWNAKRHTPDTDRCGIEKGSVFVVNLHGSVSPDESRYVGFYNNEGFGRVIYNPGFLRSEAEGKSVLRFLVEENEKCGKVRSSDDGSGLNDVLIKRVAMAAKDESDIYAVVNSFVEANRNEFRRGDERFASQWGYIRSLAENSADLTTFNSELHKYLSHGVAAEKWKYKSNILEDFIQCGCRREKKEWQDFMSKNWREVMTNLAAEMAKQCKK